MLQHPFLAHAMLWLLACLPMYAAAESAPEQTVAQAPSTHELRIATDDGDLLVFARYVGSESPQAVVIMSHGLGGSRHGYTSLSEGWAAAGFLVLHLQHRGSDNAVWEDLPRWKRLGALKQAASATQALARMIHVKTLLEHLPQWHGDPEHPLHGRIDLERIALAGHSFGSVTTLSMLGQRFGNLPPVQAPQLKVGIALSPSPSRGGTNEQAFAGITAPIICITGSDDTSVVQQHVTAKSRQAVYAALPPGQAYQLVFDGGKHGDFSDSKRNASARQAEIHRAVVAITVDFLTAHLLNQDAARKRLQAPREELQAADSWEWK